MAAGLAVVVGVAACSGGGSPDDSGGADGPDEPDDEVAGVELTTPTTPAGSGVEEPVASATGSAEVEPHVEDLLARYDAMVDRIVADPAVAHDPDDPLTQEFLALFPPGNAFAEASLEGWATNAEEGITLARLDPELPVNVTVFVAPARYVSDDEVAFEQCAVQRYVRLDDGQEVTRVDGELLAGEGTALRVDGEWRLGTLSTPEGLLGCGSRSG